MPIYLHYNTMHLTESLLDDRKKFFQFPFLLDISVTCLLPKTYGPDCAESRYCTTELFLSRPKRPSSGTIELIYKC